EGWTAERLAPLERNILRVAVHELRSRPDVPPAVSIDEAVGLARRYCQPQAAAFVNGILGRIAAEEAGLARGPGATSAPRPRPGRDSVPRWSPDGAWLAFLSTREGGVAQLHVIPAGGGEARRLTDLPEGAGAPAWSPDGRRLAVTTRVRDAAYEDEDPARRAPRRITRLLYKLDDEGWTCDRRRHVVVVAA